MDYGQILWAMMLGGIMVLFGVIAGCMGATRPIGQQSHCIERVE